MLVLQGGTHEHGHAHRFAECISEKYCTLIRYDLLRCFRKVYDVVGEGQVRQKARELIETEDDVKYKRKYLTLWKMH